MFAAFGGAAVIALLAAWTLATLSPSAGLEGILVLIYGVAALALAFLGYVAWTARNAARAGRPRALAAAALAGGIVVGYFVAGIAALVWLAVRPGEFASGGGPPLIHLAALLAWPLFAAGGNIVPILVGAPAGVAAWWWLRHG